MVARKPVPGQSPTFGTSQSPQEFRQRDSWENDSTDDEKHASLQDVPIPLRPGNRPATPQQYNLTLNIPVAQQASVVEKLDHIPDALRPGVDRMETNPFLRKRVPQSSTSPPTETLPSGNMGEANINLWEPSIKAEATGSSKLSSQPIHASQIRDDIWVSGSANVSQPPARGTETVLWPQSASGPQSSHQHVLQSSVQGLENPWNLSPRNVPLPSTTQPSPSLMSVPSDDVLTKEHDKSGKTPELPPIRTTSGASTNFKNVWDDLDRQDKSKKMAAEIPDGELSQLEDWNLVDAGPSSGPSRQSDQESKQEQPPLPPRPSGDGAQLISPKPADAKTETYQVKNIQWYDATAAQNSRISPILVQNANGPCPLVALVNALSLTTPANVSDTALVEVLRSREQISLNLLLDAVFEELMSPRRTDEDGSLPDISDLYKFLQGLHTGMNVNPRFLPTAAIKEVYERTSLTQWNSTERFNLIPGTFENTVEMSLYATFKIPLIHGWLPPTSDAAHDALERQAGSYEDAQNLLFREEELEHKLSSEDGLTPQEQQMYEDIMAIKCFFDSSATQLTPWGIEVISKAIRPGTFAILFRNDHFSTLYSHPETKQLVTLVTDDGYRSHKEVVWESLVDINGERTQYLSGDFRVVGSGSAAASINFGGYSDEHAGEWTAVQNRRNTTTQKQSELPIPSSEQEDRDLAFALQLQEEEDERHRAEQARRRSSAATSNRIIEQQGRQPHALMPNIRDVTRGPAPTGIAPARRSSNAHNIPITTAARPLTQNIRPMVPPRAAGQRRAENGADAPPPYEQAAHDEPYVPPPGHPNHPNSVAGVSRPTTNASSNSGIAVPQGHRLTGQSAGFRLSAPNAPVRQRDRDCVLM